MKTLSIAAMVSLCISPVSNAATIHASESTAYRMEVNDWVSSLKIPADWQQLPSDSGYLYFANGTESKKITFYVRPTKQNLSPRRRSEDAIRRLNRLHREVSRRGTSHLRHISRGPRLTITQDHASWMYQVVRPTGDDGKVREIGYWTIVVRQGQLDYHLELRWGQEGNESLSLQDEFYRTFGPICNTLRIEHQPETIPVSVRVQR